MPAPTHLRSTLARALATQLLPGLLAAALSPLAGAQVHKCVIDGVVTYQNTACPGGTRPPDPVPTRRRPEPSGPPTPPASAPAYSGPSATTPLPASPSTGYRCDHRRYCSQMTSCEEAYYFLNNCPGTQMDGNHDGVPCEMQWCGDGSDSSSEHTGRRRRR